ncbi:ATP-dependent DNA helicase DinG [Planococcus lenghuensis]|uniref:3'-5' exonuclease DinG n=1 Tax=Planococcus lenghuensis TaxID=2213202 RepID=A0A1Q2KZM6_9BACL|nr:ATP-dependent DNA helicase DinG [Planococcus lenghuensis]AQQ53606.1 ATP-dependent helicase DinG [Planococcus lenghuensis]
MSAPKYIVVDLETTGSSSAKGGRIIQLAMVTIEEGVVTDTYTAFINPEQNIPVFIQELTNITNEDVASALPFEQHAQVVSARLEDAVFVAHNADFDLGFLNAELKRAGLMPWQGLVVDTVELARLVYPTAYSYKLQDIAAELGILLKQAHRADDDALATAELFLSAKKQLASLPADTLRLLHKRSFSLKSDLSHLLFELISDKHTAGKDDQLRFRGIPIAVPEEMKAVWPNRYTPAAEPVQQLQTIMPGFEYRENQARLMKTIQQALDGKQEIVIEASTGMGKTIGYLLPAAEYALTEGKQVIISTYTTHLQEQLLQNEGKMLSEFLNAPISLALIKGMNHYIDLMRLYEQLQSEDESYDETFTLMQVLVWLSATQTGDLTELNTSGGGQLVIDKIRRSHLRKPAAPELKLDFYERARKRADQAHIIITNHAFLLGGGLGERQAALIIDEAHQMIQSALAKKEKTFVYTNWKYIFGQLGTLDDRQLFYHFSEVATEARFASAAELSRLEFLYSKTAGLFDEISSRLADSFARSVPNRRQKKWALLLDSLGRQEQAVRHLLKLLNEWLDLSRELLSRADRLTELEVRKQAILNDWRYWTEEIAAETIALGDIFAFPGRDDVSWVEGDLRSLPNSLAIYQRPFDVARPVSRVLEPVRRHEAVIHLSGTMSVPTDERFIIRQLGIRDEVPLIKFDPEPEFYAGARVFVVEDMPDIQQVPQAEYIESVADAVIQTVLVTEGRCFVLFTSQDMLRKTVELIQDSGLLEDYMLFAQGLSSGSRMRLLKSFQRFSKSVLFGTNSFWEGVDVPGDALRAVVVVRLPFTSPDEPVFKARSERISAEGKNPFLEYALPEAVIRLRQGFGRLIRSREDHGLFIVLDRRIETKSYGKEFLRALPPVPVAKVSLEKMVTSIEDWYNGNA